MVSGISKEPGSSGCLAVDSRRFYHPVMDAGKRDQVISFVDDSFLVPASAGTHRPSVSKNRLKAELQT